MNKRITSILLCFVMLFSMLVSVPAYAAPADHPMVFIEADRTEANPGDTITYKFYLQQPDTMTAFAFNMVAPAGLTYVEGSGTLGSSASAAWGSTFEWVPEADLQLQWYSSSGDDVTDTSKIELITIQFKVADDATIGAEYELSLTNMQLAAGSTQNYDDISATVEVSPAKVKIVAKPVAVTGVTIAETLSVSIGEAKTPAYEVLPAEATNKAVTFKSDNTAVATVNETTGLVTGQSEGTATITVTTADGGFTDTCIVTVSCSHANVTNMPAVPGTCQAGGNEAYKVCDDCGQLFNTSGAEIDAIPATGKDMNNHTGTAEWTKTAKTHAKAYTCCGTPVVAEEGHEWGGDDTCDECEYVCSHSGGTATCQSAAVCENCGLTYGSTDAENHTGGTEVINAAPANHKTQQNGYTGDTKCLGCEGIIAYGTTIPAGAHTPASTYTTDGTEHWKVCAVDGCGVEIEGTRGEHDATGANAATCQSRAKCDTCGEFYGQTGLHNPASLWSSDASGHWHECQTGGCTEKLDFDGHTPDHDGGPSEDYAVLCTECLFVIHPQQNHTHILSPVGENPKSCTNPGNKAYYTCRCGAWFWDAEGTDEIEDKNAVVIPASHEWGTEPVSQGEEGHTLECTVPGCTGKDAVQPHNLGDWLKDREGHWKECSACDYNKTKINKENHEDQNQDGVCDICLYDGSVTVEIPFVKVVEQTGSRAPGQKTFTFEVYNYGNEQAEGNVDVIANTVATNGAGTFNGMIQLKLSEEEMYQLDYLGEGFYVREVVETAEGWTYSDTVWSVMPNYTSEGWTFCKVIEGVPDVNAPAEAMTFTNSYYAQVPVVINPVRPVIPSAPSNPVPPADEAPENPTDDPVDDPIDDPADDPADEPADKEDADKEDADEPKAPAATDVPKTNDSNNPLLWIVVMMAAAVGMAASAKSRKQR